MKIYTVRETTNSNKPETVGTAIKPFETWQEAKKFSEKLFEDSNRETYISVEQSLKGLEAKVMQVSPVLCQPIRTDLDSPAVDHIMRRFEISDREAARDILKERD